MEDLKHLTVSDLIRYSRTHTGSLYPRPPIISHQNHQPSIPGTSSSNLETNPQVLTPLEYPAVLVGTLTLPTLTLKCPHKNCLQFSGDDSITVCCDIAGLEVSIIGKKIHVTTWNFIPYKHLGGGFLEIVKWELPDSSHMLSQCSSSTIDSFPLFSSSSKSIPGNAKSYKVHGAVDSVSPVSVVPCAVNHSSSSTSIALPGFIVRIMTCECKLCCSKEAVGSLYQEPDSHSFTEPVFVYFCESAWCWHPMMSKLVVNVVTISGLKKKLVFMGKQDSDMMFVTGENSFLHLHRLLKKRVHFSGNTLKGNAECGSYTGTVSNVYMQGMVVELDKEVWLLLADQFLMPPHGLRVGAVISVRNAHLVNPQFCWKKNLVLGACFRTTIKVESFSPLNTGCLIVSQSQWQLVKFIESLSFSMKLWVLLLVSCFQKKFSGILPKKIILGSKHKEGLLKMFACSNLPSSVFGARSGMFMEFNKHESCGRGTEPFYGNLKQVVPFSSFIHHCETIWIMKPLPLVNVHPISCGEKSYLPSKRKTFLSEDLGIVLVGMLKICPSSGRLQLVDATGSIDAIVPDLPSNWNPNSIFEVVDYSLTVEGMPESVHPGLLHSDPFSCKSIFECFPSPGKRNLKVFVYFHLCDTTCRNLLIYPSIYCQDESNETENGAFRLICITCKFPPLRKIKGDPMVSKRSGVFIEALVLPLYLFLAEKDGSVHPYKVSKDSAGGNYIDNAQSKRQKTDGASSQVNPGFKDNFGRATSLRETCEDHSCTGMSFSHEIPCFATIQGFTSSGKLHRTKANAEIKVCKESARKVLLEFSSESDLKYQLLQIGGIYLMKHHIGDPLCTIKKGGNLSGIKVRITSATYFRSLSFSPEALTTDLSLHDSSLCNDGVFTKDTVFKVGSDSSVSDVHLHVSSSFTGLLEIITKKLGISLNVLGADQENSSLSLGIKDTMTVNLGVNYGSLGHDCLPPGENLTSLQGDVIAIHSIDKSSSDMHSSWKDIDDLGFSDRTHSSCIHVSMTHQSVKIFGFLSQHRFPTGFGPGVNATFHQILKSRDPNTWKLTPVSFIVINSITAVNEEYSKKTLNLQSSPDMVNAVSKNMAAPSALISERIQCSDGNLFRFRCRVIAVHILILEKRNHDHLKSNLHSGPLSVGIPLACFVLDDGISSCCCWADAERAATLLRLHECTLPAYEASGKWVGVQNTASTSVMYHLQKVIEKHGRITVKSTRSISDFFDQDFTVSVSSGKALTGLDDDLYFLTSVIFNACINTFWIVVAEVMDSNKTSLVGEHLAEMEIPMPSMKNLWAREVFYVNSLSEARDMIQNL